MNCWFRYPTLKRGANNHCAYGAGDGLLQTAGDGLLQTAGDGLLQTAGDGLLQTWSAPAQAPLRGHSP
jgi:hypothetical protein